MVMQMAHFFRTASTLILSGGLGVLLGQIPEPTDAPKPRSPEESAASYRMPEGFRMELVAAEPIIASPSGVAWDEYGRLFVTELHGYNLEGQLDIEELNKSGKLDTVVRRVQAEERFKKAADAGTYGAVKLLRDTDGDGRMDRADLWSTNMPPAYGLVPARGGVIVACAPHILFLADPDGDGRAEVREILFTGFKTGALERGINAPQWGLDGWIYFGRGAGGGRIVGPRLAEPVELPGTDFRIRADGTAIEPVTGATGTFGFAMTESGDRFVMSTVDPGRQVAPLPWRYLARNREAAFTGLEAGGADRRVFPLAPAHPWRTKRAGDAAYFKFYRDRYGPSDSDAAGWFTSACSPMIYQDRALPGLHGHYFVCEPSGNLIHRAVIEPDGVLLKLRRAPNEAGAEFAASNDSWSHPMNLAHGPDGCLWVVDYYREIIEDYSAIPRHLQQQYGLYAGHDRGRIYRVTHRDMPRPDPADMSRLDLPALARELGSPSFWRRGTAQRLLAEHGRGGPEEPVTILRRLLKDPRSTSVTIIAALRTLEMWGKLGESDLIEGMSHPSEPVRVHALELAESGLRSMVDAQLLKAVLASAAVERSPRVCIQLALTLGESRRAEVVPALAALLRKHGSVRWIEAAVLSSLSGRALEMMVEWVKDPLSPAGFLTPLAQSLAARRNDGELEQALLTLRQAPPAMQAAALKGLAQGRKNAPRRPTTLVMARNQSAPFLSSDSEEVRTAVRELEEILRPESWRAAAHGPGPGSGALEKISEDRFRQFTGALQGARDLNRGREVFRQACATCHRVGEEGHEVGPDLLGQSAMAEESLLKEILLPSERIRPGYETTVLELRESSALTGILKEEGATSLTLVLPNGVEQTILRKEIRSVMISAGSLMPSFAETLAPSDAAHLLAWLKQQKPSGTPDATPRQ